MIYLAVNLKYLRQRRGASQDVVAIALDVKRSSYSGYENGTAEPCLAVLLRMSEYFRIPLDNLVGQDLVTIPEFRLGTMERAFTPINSKAAA
ncbi:MAG TPA: helix-turn-helix transcriptional regulator [Flavobacteriales bacterium]|nr:helix-turn-helix transcriptional regulator [Flavobacteriales bacterium]